LRLGFGWSSRKALRDLCCTLWATSRREIRIVEALFDQLEVPTWELPRTEVQLEQSIPVSVVQNSTSSPSNSTTSDIPRLPQIQAAQGSMPPISLTGVDLPESHFLMIPHYPLTFREVAQAWRRLRRFVRAGPSIELDVAATVELRSSTGVASRVVLTPRRRNVERLLLLIDRQGSMVPFHGFVDEVQEAIRQASGIERVAIFYFHDVPAQGADETLLDRAGNGIFPTLDAIHTEIHPLRDGLIYTDAQLTTPVELDQVLKTHAFNTAVVLISDAGASRGSYDPVRLLDTAAFIKGLYEYRTRCVWLNPMPEERWAWSTAAQIARHVPMFSLDRSGLYRAINVLRGQPFLVERPL
jgi:uncharacterized protein with von Willebrand factor type A (vWA) domain